jgi:hypothetical protein
MLQKHAESYEVGSNRTPQVADRSLQFVLWTIWTLAVVGSALYNWRADIVANQPVDIVGLVIYSVLTGLVGMLVITMIELRLDPGRFLD